MTGPQPARDYPPIPSPAETVLTVAADLSLTALIVVVLYFWVTGLAEVIV